MNSFHVLKTIPLYLTFVDSDTREIRSVNVDFSYSLRTHLAEKHKNEDVFIFQNISFQTINEFLEKNLYQSIVYSFKETKVANNLLADFDNNFIVLPNVSESILLPALHAKLNTICHPESEIDMVELSYADGLKYNYINVDGFYEALPDVKDWIGELSFWSTPWWFRKDFSTFDNFAESQEELDKFLNDEEHQNGIDTMMNSVDKVHSEIAKQLSPNKSTGGELVHIDFKNKSVESDKKS